MACRAIFGQTIQPAISTVHQAPTKTPILTSATTVRPLAMDAQDPRHHVFYAPQAIFELLDRANAQTTAEMATTAIPILILVPPVPKAVVCVPCHLQSNVQNAHL